MRTFRYGAGRVSGLRQLVRSHLSRISVGFDYRDYRDLEGEGDKRRKNSELEALFGELTRARVRFGTRGLRDATRGCESCHVMCKSCQNEDHIKQALTGHRESCNAAPC